MSLDNFTSGSASGSPVEKDEQKGDKHDVSQEDYYKTIGSGRFQKVFKTEEEWEETVEIVENRIGKDINEVLNLDPQQRHDIFHNAILIKNGIHEEGEFYLTRDCIVCGYTFVFPNDWDFEKFEGEPVCKDHTIGEVEKSYEEINSWG